MKLLRRALRLFNLYILRHKGKSSLWRSSRVLDWRLLFFWAKRYSYFRFFNTLLDWTLQMAVEGFCRNLLIQDNFRLAVQILRLNTFWTWLRMGLATRPASVIAAANIRGRLYKWLVSGLLQVVHQLDRNLMSVNWRRLSLMKGVFGGDLAKFLLRSCKFTQRQGFVVIWLWRLVFKQLVSRLLIFVHELLVFMFIKLIRLWLPRLSSVWLVHWNSYRSVGLGTSVCCDGVRTGVLLCFDVLNSFLGGRTGKTGSDVTICCDATFSSKFKRKVNQYVRRAEEKARHN